jgi:uncharacterized membrane protein YccC
MTGKLDDISFKMGQQAEGIEGLKESFDRHCVDDDRRDVENIRRHNENIKAIRELGDGMRLLSEVLKPLADSVAFMRPIVDRLQITKSKLAVVVALGFAIVSLIGWIGFSVVAKAIAFVISLGARG